MNKCTNNDYFYNDWQLQTQTFRTHSSMWTGNSHSDASAQTAVHKDVSESWCVKMYDVLSWMMCTFKVCLVEFTGYIRVFWQPYEIKTVRISLAMLIINIFKRYSNCAFQSYGSCWTDRKNTLVQLLYCWFYAFSQPTLRPSSGISHR